MDYIIKVNNEDKTRVIKDIYMKTSVIHLLLSLITSLAVSSIFLIGVTFSRYIVISLVLTLVMALWITIPVLKSLNISHEEISIEESEFSYSYVDKNSLPESEKHDKIKERDEIIIRFDEIQRIEINHIYNTVTIYGPMVKKLYSDFENNRIKKVRKIENIKSYCTILPVFDEVEQFARFVSNKSGKTLIHIRYPWINKLKQDV